MVRRRSKQKRFDVLSTDMEELARLCRKGDLFGVQKWIESGRPVEPGPGKFRRTPLRVAIETGFLSMVEVLLSAGIERDEKTRALRKALDLGRADIFELLVRHGADHATLDFEEVMESRQKEVIEWYVRKGADWDRGYPIAHALARGQREFLGIYMGLRDEVPTARLQASMALRKHCYEGRMRWVALLLWAGADPYLSVPDLDYPDDEDCYGSALGAAISRGHSEIVLKIGIDPARCDVSQLLATVWLLADTRIVEALLAAGADPNAQTKSGNPMDSLAGALGWALDTMFKVETNVEAVMRSLEAAASKGGRCRFTDSGSLAVLRRSLAKVSREEAIALLRRLLICGAIEPQDMRRLMATPKMQFILRSEVAGADKLREGLKARRGRKLRRS